jgi:predicted DCC family thiol-disulfide oxidoreductase YuxK
MKNKEICNLPDYLAYKQPIVFFDGECTLCSSSVKFLLRHNHSRNLSFASLQSDAGIKLTGLAGKSFQKSNSLLLLQDNKLFRYSTAVIKITKHLDFPWHMLGILIIVPVFIRDLLYRFIVKKRYKWFGREPFCITSGGRYQERFIS